MTQEAMKLALEWIEKQPEEITASKYDDNSRYVVIKELEAALANQEQGEPVAWADYGVLNWIADKQFRHAALLYEHPQQKKAAHGIKE
jgi:hypothetical protein